MIKKLIAILTVLAMLLVMTPTVYADECAHTNLDEFSRCKACGLGVCPDCRVAPKQYLYIPREATCETEGTWMLYCSSNSCCAGTNFSTVQKKGTVPALGHIDEDKDHYCDRCDFSFCKDEKPADHKCDICKKVLSECRDESPVDHKCDICKKVFSECRDENPADHKCDICDAVLSQCRDAAPPDYICDICGKEVPEHTTDGCTHIDINGYRICGNCKQPVCPKCNGVPEVYQIKSEPTCEETGLIVMACVCQNTPTKIVICDIPALGHIDANNDHLCDRCNNPFCKDENPADHKCDICKKVLSVCKDDDPADHKCDICKKVLSVCKDEDPTDHQCDICNKVLSECKDNNPADHKCDICKKVLSECRDENPEYLKCDICGKEVPLKPCTHKSINNYRICNRCNEPVCPKCNGVPEVYQIKTEPTCEETGLITMACVCQNTPTKIVICEIPSLGHVDANNDHICDRSACKITLSECSDNNPADHKCDLCQTTLSGHTGGKATCKDKAICDICDEVYGKLDAANHTGETVWTRNETQHEKKWNCCGASVVSLENHEWENGICTECEYRCGHTGGTATCKDKAICDICDEVYGELDAANHTGETVWTKNETQHEKKWNCCSASVVSLENHEWENGVCTECEYRCGHKGGTATCKDKAICDICDEPYDELDASNHAGAAVWTKTETQHEKTWNCCDASVVSLENHEWENGVCTECGYSCGHTGGTATCRDKAVCSVCGNEYGEVDSSNHNLEKIPAKDATVTETGNKEYWHCKDCDNISSDKDGKNSIELKDTVIAKLPPEIIKGKGQSLTAVEKKDLIFRSNAAFSDFIRVELDGRTLDEKNYTVKEGSTVVTLKADYVTTLSAGEHTIGIVSTSGTAATTFTVNAKATVDTDTKSPQTGDNSHMALWIALLAASVFGLAGTAVYSKRKRAR